MKCLEKIVKDRRALVFLDLEGTQFSHEMIEIGAYVAVLNDDLTVKKVLPGFKAFVKAHHPIGSVVLDLTGISQAKLDKEGRAFAETETRFRKYVGKYWESCLFVTFGSHDLRIVNQSVLYNPESSKEIAHEINRCDFDFSAYLSQYVQDPNSNPLSLANYLKVFEVPFEGRAHDALADAFNLLDLYKAVLARKDILAREYKKTLGHLRHLPPPLNKAVSSLNAGTPFTPEMWDEAIAEAFK
jgi:inhibitor of KinA sporulation pathway (predicted exonuclease)